MQTEFFRVNSNLTHSPEMVKQDGEYKTFAQVNTTNFERIVFSFLLKNEKSREVVKKMQAQGITKISDIILQFKRCNWDALDDKPDMDQKGNLFFEYVECGFKSRNKRCPFSQEGDPKPFCIIKHKFNLPNN